MVRQKNAPLFLLNTSIPMTCAFGRHEFIFHICYGDNRMSMIELISASAERMNSLVPVQELSDTVRDLRENPGGWAIERIRALFFLLLNVDIQLKEYLCNTSDKELLAATLNVNVADLPNTSTHEMTGSAQADKETLRRFFADLNKNIVPEWLQCEAKKPSELAREVQQCYIAC